MYLTSVMLFSEQKFSHYLSVLFGLFLIALPLHFLWFWSADQLCFWKWLCLERQHSEYSTKLCLCLWSHGYNNGTVMCFFFFSSPPFAAASNFSCLSIKWLPIMRLKILCTWSANVRSLPGVRMESEADVSDSTGWRDEEKQSGQ